jgi:hypothetical protein
MIELMELVLIEKNKDKLLQILLYKEYRREFIEREVSEGFFEMKHPTLSFYEWLEKILEEF